MLAKLFSYTLIGIDATPVEVEVDVSASSMPKTILVGLAETAVKESTHRVERAIVNSGYRRPIDRVVINLAPADLKKDAGGFDLSIALGLLLGSGQVAFDRTGSFFWNRGSAPPRCAPRMRLPRRGPGSFGMIPRTVSSSNTNPVVDARGPLGSFGVFSTGGLDRP